MKSLATPRRVLSVFLLFILASVVLLASSEGRQDRRSLGRVDVGRQKVLITYGPNERLSGDERFMSQLPADVLTAEARRFANIISKVGVFASDLKMPSYVHMSIGEVTNSPAADSFNRVLYLGQRYGRVDKDQRLYTQHPRAMDPVVAHEFGHMIFHETVLASIPEIQRQHEVLQRVVEMQIKLSRLAERYKDYSERGDARSTAESNRILREAKDLSKAIKVLEGPISLAKEIRTISSPYNEFFADVVAVLYTEDPNAVADAVHMVTTQNSGESGKKKRLYSEIRNRQFLRRGSGAPVVLSGHAIFYEAREFLWSEYLRRPQIMRAYKREVLRGVARAIRAELEWAMRANSLVSDNPQAALHLVNRRLIERIRLELGDL